MPRPVPLRVNSEMTSHLNGLNGGCGRRPGSCGGAFGCHRLGYCESRHLINCQPIAIQPHPLLFNAAAFQIPRICRLLDHSTIIY
jgi:hypothetical protein